MKRLFLIIQLFVLINLPAFSIELEGTTWGPEKRGHGFYLTFSKNNSFKLSFSGEGGGQNVIGSYSQKQNDVLLNIETVNEWGVLPAYTKQKEIKCKIEDTDSLFSKYKLVGTGGLELWNLDHKPEEDKKCKVGDFIIYVFNATGKLNENARIREGPGLEYKYYSFSFEDFETINHSLPKGYTLDVLGYSEITTIVDGIGFPWYYCVFRKNMWENQYCWIWGGLIDIKG